MNRIMLKCAECGMEFSRLPCQLTRGRGRYCSKACLGKSKRHGSRLYCAMCDGEFYRRFGEQADSERQFCSRLCYSEWRAATRAPDTYIKEGHRHLHRLVAEA